MKSNKNQLLESGYKILKEYNDGQIMIQRPNNGFCSIFKSFSEAMKYYTKFPTHKQNELH